MDNKYSKGSEWRKWDFHVHTPASVLNNQFGDNWDDYVKTLFTLAIEKEIACIGITDYFSIEGYKKIISEYIKCPEKLYSLFADKLKVEPDYINKVLDIMLIPNVELRLDNILSINSNDKNKNSRLEYHLILSNELSINQIQDNVLSQLQFSSACSTQLGTDHAPLTRTNLENLGAKLKATQTEFADKPNYYVGCMCAAINFDSLTDAIKKMSNELVNKFLFVAVEDDITKINWADQGHQTRKKIYANSHMIFSQSQNTIKWGLKEETKDEFSTYKGCIWGSDAHDYNKLFIPDNNRYCWIKADPTFSGLLQVAIQPQNRVYIGNIPPSLDLANKNKSKYIKSIYVSKKNNARNSETWFDVDIPINPRLVAIIGNKGSGKSALADIIGFLCHCKSMEHASFLHKERFQRGDKKYAEDYCGKLVWTDEHELTENSLLNYTENSMLEYAKYLPQKYIEIVCGDLGDEFQDEINHVIFSYIDKPERGDASNLAELIDKKCIQLYEEIRAEQNKLESINKKIIALEDKCAPKYKEECTNKLNHFKGELNRIIENKPAEVIDPSINEDAANAKRILEIDKEITLLESQIESISVSLGTVNNDLDVVDYFIRDIQSIMESVNDLNSRYDSFLKEKSLTDESSLVKIAFNDSLLKNYRKQLESRKQEYLGRLNSPQTYIDWEDVDFVIRCEAECTNSLPYAREKLLHEKSELISRTSIEQQAYQKYKDDLKDWEEQQKILTGNAQTEETILYFENALKYIDETLKSDLLEQENQRYAAMKVIYEKNKQIATILSGLYAPVKQKLDNILCNVEDNVDFTADIVVRKDLSPNIVQKIDKRAKSAFHGVTEATAFIDEQIRSTNFNDYDSYKAFFDIIIAKARGDYSLLKNVIPDRDDFYQYLSELRFLSVEYTLKLGDKAMKELSPGERGMVLLVFYLALSKDNIPLIIDQPEDNLDNQSVYKKLVPCINEAKNNRQVIIVTHNPNIAVACDAEQIIYCSIDKSKTHISYVSGSIENPDVRAKVIDVLEGTEPAFDLRKSKYFFDFSHPNANG